MCLTPKPGKTPPSFPDTETTFDELKARLAKTVAYIKTATPAQIDGSEDKEIVLKIGGNDLKLKGQPYFLHFFLPNFMFHAATAYNVLLTCCVMPTCRLASAISSVRSDFHLRADVTPGSPGGGTAQADAKAR